MGLPDLQISSTKLPVIDWQGAFLFDGYKLLTHSRFHKLFINKRKKIWKPENFMRYFAPSKFNELTQK